MVLTGSPITKNQSEIADDRQTDLAMSVSPFGRRYSFSGDNVGTVTRYALSSTR